jgi:hypothetical protein
MKSATCWPRRPRCAELAPRAARPSARQGDDFLTQRVRAAGCSCSRPPPPAFRPKHADEARGTPGPLRAGSGLSGAGDPLLLVDEVNFAATGSGGVLMIRSLSTPRVHGLALHRLPDAARQTDQTGQVAPAPPRFQSPAPPLRLRRLLRQHPRPLFRRPLPSPAPQRQEPQPKAPADNPRVCSSVCEPTARRP